MKNYTTQTGATISISDDGIATVACKLGTGTIGSKGVRYNHTMTRGANLGGGRRGLVVDGISAGKQRLVLGLTTDVETWLYDNWPIRKTDTEMWDELMPADARAMRDHNLKLASYELEFGRRMESESESSVLPTRPTDVAPELTAEGRAWLEIDVGCDKHNYEIQAIYSRARKAAVDGIPLTDALAQAEREMEEFRNRHAWD